MSSQHVLVAQSPDLSSGTDDRAEVREGGPTRRRLIPARIVREVDDPMHATFDAEVANEMVLSGLDVGVVDTGVVLGERDVHPYLQLHGAGFKANVDTKDRTDPGHSYGHGTFVAGVILREAPSARIHMKAALDTASGEWEDDLVARAIRELGEAGVTLINLSFSGNELETETPDVITQALRGLGDGVVVVAAAGNFGNSNPVHPAAVGFKGENGEPLVIAVGAVDTSTSRDDPPIADFSGRGEWVHAYANGRRVFGPHQDAGWVLWSGSSFACATVTGRIAATMVRDASTAREAAATLLGGDGPKVIDEDGRQKPYITSQAAPLTIPGKLIPQ